MAKTKRTQKHPEKADRRKQPAISETAADAAVNLVPVKVMYPGRPPATEPEWVHWSWIHATASGLGDFGACVKRRKAAFEMAQVLRVRTFEDEQSRYWVQEVNELADEVVPLFDECRAYLPLEAWSKFQHIRNRFDAEKDLTAATQEWAALRDLVSDMTAKYMRALEAGPAEAQGGQGALPASGETPEGEAQGGGREVGSGDTNPTADRKTARKWKRWHEAQIAKKNYKASFAQYAEEKSLNAKAVKDAVDRDRKR